MKSYQSGYKALRRICLDREISIFRLLEEESFQNEVCQDDWERKS